MAELNTDNMLSRIANYKAKTSFTEAYCKPDNLRERKIEGLGLAIASWTEWSGNAILGICKAALEDANFHTEAEQIQKMINKMMLGN